MGIISSGRNNVGKTKSDVIKEHPLAAKFLDYLKTDPGLKQYPSNPGSFSYHSNYDKGSDDHTYENYYRIEFYPVGANPQGWNPFDVMVKVLWERRQDVVYLQYKYRGQQTPRVLKFKTEEEFSEINEIIEKGMESNRQKKRAVAAKETEMKFSNIQLRSHLDDVISEEKQNLMEIRDSYRKTSTVITSKRGHRYNMEIEKNKNKDEYKFVAKIRVNLPLDGVLKTLREFFENLPITPEEKKLYLNKVVDFKPGS